MWTRPPHVWSPLPESLVNIGPSVHGGLSASELASCGMTIFSSRFLYHMSYFE